MTHLIIRILPNLATLKAWAKRELNDESPLWTSVMWQHSGQEVFSKQHECWIQFTDAPVLHVTTFGAFSNPCPFLTTHGLDNTGVILQHWRGWMFPRWLFTLLLFYSGGSGEVRLNPPCSRWQELLNLQGFSPARHWDRCQRSDSAFCLLFAVIRACVSGSSRSWMTPLKRFWTLQGGPKSTNFSFTSAPKSLMQNTHVSVIKPAAPGPVSRSQLTKSDWLKGRRGILWNFLGSRSY